MTEKSTLARIDVNLYKAIKKEQEMLEMELGRQVSFSKASKLWFKKVKGSDFQIIRF